MKERTKFPWKDEYNELVAYNKRCLQGIMHTQEYSKRMSGLQQQYNNDLAKWHKENILLEK